MFKRSWWVFLMMAAVGVMAWMVFSRAQPNTNATGVISSGKTSVGRPAARNSDAPEGESEQDGARQSSRHSTGELEKYQVEKQRLSQLKRAVLDQEDKLEEKRKVLAAIVRTKAIIYHGPDADSSEKAGAVEEQRKANSPDQIGEAVRRGLDAQDYIAAKRDFETDQKLLQEMKLKLIEEQILIEEQMKFRRDGK
jgi:hypothetical protein